MAEAPYVVGARRSPPRIPGDGVDHGASQLQAPPGAYGWMEFSPHGYIGRYLFVTAAISNAGGPH